MQDDVEYNAAHGLVGGARRVGVPTKLLEDAARLLEVCREYLQRQGDNGNELSRDIATEIETSEVLRRLEDGAKGKVTDERT